MPTTANTRAILAESRDLLLALREQNEALIRQGEDREELLERIARAAEKTAARTFWIALPVYVTFLAMLATVFLWAASRLMAR